MTRCKLNQHQTNKNQQIMTAKLATEIMEKTTKTLLYIKICLYIITPQKQENANMSITHNTEQR